ncbi:MAG: PAS domain S-box protein [Spirochaetes bacterium]|nr:MAG: PAS domain S-box protein [Spirochaetota bacterium]
MENEATRDDAGRFRDLVIQGPLDENEMRDLFQGMLDDQENRYEALIQNIQEYIYSVSYSHDGLTSTYHSERSREVTGYSPEDYLKNPALWYSMIHASDRERVNDFLRRVNEDRRTNTIEHRIIRKDGKLRWVSNTCTAVTNGDGRLERLNGFVLDITEHKTAELRMQLAVRVLDVLNKSVPMGEAIREIVALIRRYADIEAVGIRLRDNGDYPYIETEGFTRDFVKSESSLLGYDPDGAPALDAQGRPVLECLCGAVMRDQIPPGLGERTGNGGFWTNDAPGLLASRDLKELEIRVRGRCFAVGYRSVALIPLKSGEDTIGLLQLNDSRADAFTPGLLEYFEGIGASIGIALSRKIAEEGLRKAHAELESRVQDRTSALNEAVQSLNAERRRFNEVLDVLPAYVVLLTADYRVSFANRFFKERFGDSGGRRCYEFLFERSAPCKNCKTFTALTTMAPSRWEWAGPDGRQYDISDFPFVDTDGSILVLEMGLDISERKRAETELDAYRLRLEELVARRTGELVSANARLQSEILERMQIEGALREHETRYRSLYNALSELTVLHEAVLDKKGAVVNYRIIDANPAFTAVTGIPREHALGALATDLYGTETAPFLDVYARVATTGEPEKFEAYFAPLNRHFSISAISPSPGTFATISNDITEQKRAEQALRESEERLSRFASATFEGIVMSENGVIIDCNEQFALMMGRSVGGLKGMQMTGMIAPEDRERIMEDIRLNRDSDTELALLREDGDRIYVEAHGRSAGSDSLPGRRYMIVRDVTDRRRREDELRRLNRTLKAMGESSKAMMRAGEDEMAYLNEVCRIIVEDCGHSMVWIGFAEEDAAKSVRPAAFAGFEKGYLETLNLTWSDSERGRGPTGTAVRTGKPVACRNIDTDPAFAPWRAQALARGYFSSISLPLVYEGRVMGALSIYSTEKDPFSESETGLLMEIANDLAYGITTLRLRAEHARVARELRESREDLNRAQAVAMTGSWRLDVRTNELRWSDENHRIFGIAHGTQLTYDTFLSTVHADDRAYVDKMWSEGLRGRPYDIEHRIVAHGITRWVRERAELEYDNDGDLRGGFGTTQDITERKRVEEALKESEGELRQRNLAMEEDLRIAQLVQSRFLPRRAPGNERIRTEYRYLPHYAVGGDYFSFANFEDIGLGIFLGDVVGHGVAAALFLSLLKAATDRVCRRHGSSPGEYLGMLNDELIQYMDANFITAIYGLFRYRDETGPLEFVFSNGGHPMPILHRRSADSIELLNAKGTILGAIPGMMYEEKTVTLNPGDRLFLYTDGIPEAQNESGKLLGFDEMRDVIARASRPGLGETLDGIMGEVYAHRGLRPLEDDIVLIGFEVP